MTVDVVTLLQRLVACNTSNPPGNEAQAVAILEEVLLAAGVECERVAKDPERPNLVARLRGRGGGPSLAGNGDDALLSLARLLDHFARHPAEKRVTGPVEPLLDLFSAGGIPAERVAAVHAANAALGEIAESLTTNVFVPTTAQSQ